MLRNRGHQMHGTSFHDLLWFSNHLGLLWWVPAGKGAEKKEEARGQAEETDCMAPSDGHTGHSPAGTSQEEQGETTVDGEGGETVSEQHTPAQGEPSDQRTEPPLPKTTMDWAPCAKSIFYHVYLCLARQIMYKRMNYEQTKKTRKERF